MTIRFDDSLPLMVSLIVETLGATSLESGVVLREASGRLAFFTNQQIGPERIESISQRLRRELGAYARPDRVLADPDSSGASAILADVSFQVLSVAGRVVRVLDRRVVGADWLRSPSGSLLSPPRIVFASLKGGVGRSTALSVLASDQARKGRNVLVLDLDLEAPGIGSMLLDRSRVPRLGFLDLLVEDGLENVDLETANEAVGTSALTDGFGLVDVVPVAGSTSWNQPENYMSKLSRAMQEHVDSTGNLVPLAEKTRRIVDLLCTRRSYDLVLVDARAGMAELTAGPLLALGANVLLFGTAQPQTIEGYRYLLAHLSTLARSADDSPWQQLKMVHAKAALSPDAHMAFQGQLWELFTEYLYEEVDGLEGFNFDVNDPDAPHNPLSILLDARFADWDPVARPTDLDRTAYEGAFGSFIQEVERLADASQSSEASPTEPDRSIV